MKEYKIIQQEFAYEFEKALNLYAEKGWRLIKAFCNERHLYAVMERDKDEMA